MFKVSSSYDDLGISQNISIKYLCKLVFKHHIFSSILGGFTVLFSGKVIVFFLKIPIF